MRILTGKPVDLVLDRRAIPGTDALDHARVHGTAVQPRTDDVVGPGIGVRHPARNLTRMHGGIAHDGEHGHRIEVARLFAHAAEIDGAAVDARRRTRLQSALPQVQFFQARGQGDGGRITGAAGRVGLQAHVNLTVQKSTRRQHHGSGAELQADLGHGTHHLVAFDDEVVDRLLEQPQIRLVFQLLADGRLVQDAVGLCAGGAHGRSLGRVQDAELDTGQVGGQRHRATHGVDFLDQVALADAADGRVARHLAQGFDVVGKQQSGLPHAGAGECGFGTGMAAADDDDVEFSWK